MRAFITGISGQDGSYLSELLLSKGYEVFGMIRRHSVAENQQYRLSDISDKINVFYGDMTDAGRVEELINEVRPDEVYNLAAQSHVRISFDIPHFTAQTNAIGVLNILEAVRKYAPKAKFYQASSSEMFGLSVDGDSYQRESTPMNPASPYGIAKVFAYNMTRHYRRAYRLHACNGILFNHESILKNSPVIVRDQFGLIDILPIEDIFRSEKHRYEGILHEYLGMEVWDGGGWTHIINGTCYRDIQKPTRVIQTRASVYETTDDHVVFMGDNSEKKNKDVVVSDKMYATLYPDNNFYLSQDEDFCRFLGYCVAEGYIAPDGAIYLTNQNEQELTRYCQILNKMYGWDYRFEQHPSGYENGNVVTRACIKNDTHFGKWLRKEIYTRHSLEKRIPKFILNSDVKYKIAFYEGYYDGDGRKEGNETYSNKGFTTKSATLCCGLIYLLRGFSTQTIKCKLDYRGADKRYYYVQLGCGYDTHKGQHLKKPKHQVISTYETHSEDGWFFDLQTETQCFATGANLVKVHNSPRRGANFVTKKVVIGACEIYLGRQDSLELGNMDSYRDWGHSKDYVRAMNMIINADPSDWVVATGETHSIREMCEVVFSYLNMDYKDYVIQNPKYMRPEELPYLRGDSSRIRATLGWSPEYTFETLLKEMVDDYLQKNTNKL